MRKTGLTVLLVWAIGGFCIAQDSIPPEIRVDEKGDSLQFSAALRPLRQVAGAPSSFYTYFWEMGDGRFSFDKEPLYSYRDTGLYQVRLYATNNYDDGKAPPTHPRPVKIRKKPNGANTWASHFFQGNGNIEMKVNRNPRPGEDFVTLIGYRNQSGDSLKGSLVLFYNERQFGQDAFSLTEKRYYNGEDSSSLGALMASLTPEPKKNGLLASTLPTEPIANNLISGPVPARDPTTVGLSGQAAAIREASSQIIYTYPNGEDALPLDGVMSFNSEARSLLHNLQVTYKQHTVLHFSAIPSGEEKFVFMDLTTLPGMLQDTNAMVGLTALLIPDDPTRAPERVQLDVQVVASHDPNRLQLKSRRINYRFMKKTKELTYRVQFQNTGKGPAKKIAIGIAIPRQLNTSSIQLKTMSPVCTWCDSAYNRQSCIDTIRTADSVYFVFNNIYLPGLQQDGVTNKDSTQGFVEYSIRFKKKPKKIPFSTSAAIVFDKNEPVFTNKATARFIKGLSPGIMVGYSALPSSGGYSAKGPLQFGYVLAPYAPSRPYFQAEIFVGLLQQDQFTSAVVKDQRDTAIGPLKFIITGRSGTTITKRNSLEITPLHYRYNIGNWLGVGLGAMVQVNLSEQTTEEKKVYLTTPNLPLEVTTAVSTTKSGTRWLGNWNAAPFADIQVGRVKTGPVLGMRYIRLLKGDITNRFFLYAGFKL